MFLSRKTTLKIDFLDFSAPKIDFRAQESATLQSRQQICFHELQVSLIYRRAY